MGTGIDTSVVIHAERTGVSLATLVGRELEECFISVITLSELLHGLARATSPRIRRERQIFLEDTLADLKVLPIDEEVAKLHASLTADLGMRGAMIGVNDSWIAATCLRHRHEIVTLNVGELSRVPGLVVRGLPR